MNRMAADISCFASFKGSFSYGNVIIIKFTLYSFLEPIYNTYKIELYKFLSITNTGRFFFKANAIYLSCMLVTYIE